MNLPNTHGIRRLQLTACRLSDLANFETAEQTSKRNILLEFCAVQGLATFVTGRTCYGQRTAFILGVLCCVTGNVVPKNEATGLQKDPSKGL